MDSWIFIFYFDLQSSMNIFILFLKLLELWPSEAFSFGIYVPLIYHRHCVSTCMYVYINICVILWHYKMLQAHLAFFLHQSQNQEVFILLLKNGTRNIIYLLHVIIATEFHCFQALSADRARKHIYIQLAHVYIYLQIFLYLTIHIHVFILISLILIYYPRGHYSFIPMIMYKCPLQK